MHGGASQRSKAAGVVGGQGWGKGCCEGGKKSIWSVAHDAINRGRGDRKKNTASLTYLVGGLVGKIAQSRPFYTEENYLIKCFKCAKRPVKNN